MENIIFTPDTQEALQQLDEQSEQKAKQIGNEHKKALFFSCFFAHLVFFEYHIMYSAFRQIAGDDNPFWSPPIMGFSALILVMAVHFFVEQSKNHPAVQFINVVVSKMVPVYLVGIGLLLAVLLYKYGLGAMLDTDHAKLNMETMQMEGQSWVSWVMLHIATPLAALVFSVGLGALAIVNVFVAHNAFDKAALAKKTIVQLTYNQSANKADIAIYFDALARFEEAQNTLKSMHVVSDEQLKAEVTSELSLKLQQAKAQAFASLSEA
ncbi:MAG: hypothetical protein ABJH28_05165 [Paraglaciecola sp.]|uniref:hypothetical protein n=1 Tax=Paraglaciecola sp. TaxID=1920173 RepID=UPI0032649357